MGMKLSHGKEASTVENENEREIHECVITKNSRDRRANSFPSFCLYYAPQNYVYMLFHLFIKHSAAYIIIVTVSLQFLFIVLEKHKMALCFMLFMNVAK